MALVDLEKAFDSVPSEMVIATLQPMGVLETEVRMVEGITRRQQQEWWWEKKHRRNLRLRLD